MVRPKSVLANQRLTWYDTSMGLFLPTIRDAECYILTPNVNVDA